MGYRLPLVRGAGVCSGVMSDVSRWFRGELPPGHVVPRGDASERLLAEAKVAGICVPLDVPGAEEDIDFAELQLLRDAGASGGWAGRLHVSYKRGLEKYRRFEGQNLHELVALGSMHGARPRLLEIRVFSGPNFSRPAKTNKLLSSAREACAEWFALSVTEEQDAQRASFEDRRDAQFVAREAELYAHLEAHGDDEEAWRVFGDWLHEHGDPRGEIIATNPDPDRVRALLPAIVGELAERDCIFDLAHGHPRAVTVLPKGAAGTLKLLAEHPSTRFLASVSVRSSAKATIAPLLDLLRARPVRELRLDGASAFPLDKLQSRVPLEVLSVRQTTGLASLAALTSLRELTIHAAGQARHTTEPVDLNHLRSLSALRTLKIFASDYLHLEAIGDLRDLRELWLCIDRAGLDPEPLTRTPLERLVTFRDTFPPDALARLAEASIDVRFRNRDA